jgi:hypothetical protein
VWQESVNRFAPENPAMDPVPQNPPPSSRRHFLGTLATGLGIGRGLALGLLPTRGESRESARPEFRGRNVILVRFGGGVRRRESIDPDHTFAPHLCRDLIPQGTLFPRMEIAQLQGLNTSHGEGTLNLLTGRYDRYQDINDQFLRARFEPRVPTVGEYLRKAFDVAPHETLIVNGEDRPDEEFYSFSNHAGYGVDFRANVLSLYRFKRWLLETQIAEGTLQARDIEQRRRQLAQWERADPRAQGRDGQGPRIAAFWQRWREHYGDSGRVNPRGDRLLTTLTLRALRELRPRFVMLNYNDCDYVHWGYLSHYTTGVSIMDEGIRELVAAVNADPFYRDNTVFAVVPDCGRDSNPLAAVPCQHHFNSRSSHEIFALLFGPGIARGVRVDHLVQQADVAPTLTSLLGCRAEHAEGRILEEALA